MVAIERIEIRFTRQARVGINEIPYIYFQKKATEFFDRFSKHMGVL